jgi:hypothetical protein
MKITVTQTEVQYFTIVKEVEMSENEYAEYLKTGKVSFELQSELSSQVELSDFDYCEVIETKLEEVLAK